MNLLPDPESPVSLPDNYRKAIIGITITGSGASKLVYSLSRLCLLVETQERRREKQAQKKVVDMIFALERDHGDRAPVFVDDASSEMKHIITPYGN